MGCDTRDAGTRSTARTVGRGEGAPLSWRPSADAVAGNGRPLSWGRGGCSDGARPEPSADAVAERAMHDPGPIARGNACPAHASCPAGWPDHLGVPGVPGI